jgi:hypothetical protein
MNSTLEQTIYQADGRYFTDSELTHLENYLGSYQLRLETYQLLQERGDQLVLQALRKLAQTDRGVVQEHGEKCKRDMGYVLCSLALAILKDDENGFREQLILWMQNIMSALRKEAQSARAYRFLQDVIREQVSAPSAELINRYLTDFIEALTAGS